HAIPVISVSSDSFEDSVGTPAGRTDSTVIPTETPIIAPTIPPSPDYTPAYPDYSPASNTESDPSKDPSSGHIPPLPAVSPFLSSDDDTTDNSSLRHSLSDHSSPGLPSTFAGPSCKRRRSPMTSVPALPPISEALSLVRADLIPSPKRVRDIGYLALVEVGLRETRVERVTRSLCFVLKMRNNVTPPDTYSIQAPFGGHAIPVISVSSDSSEDSVGTPAGRVILFSTIPTTIPDTTPVITPPTTQTDSTVIPTETPIIAPTIPPSPDYTPAYPNYSPASKTESDPSKDPSSGHIPPLPAVSPFLSSDDDTTDSDTPDTPP
nr:hypothetical protein [Tanacetum cinerariifolium]